MHKTRPKVGDYSRSDVAARVAYSCEGEPRFLYKKLGVANNNVEEAFSEAGVSMPPLAEDVFVTKY